MKTEHRKFVSIPLALSMVLCMVPATATVTSAETSGSQPQIIAQDTVQGSAILHCFDWSFDEIKAHLPEIAASGYTAVQTSPVQPAKDYNAAWTDTNGQWWKLYQPLGFRIAGEGESWLGSAADLTELCTEAERYGIKVIVDVVSNHLANNVGFAAFKQECGGSFDGHLPYENLSPQVDEDMKNAAYYHNYFESAYTDKNWNNLRFTDTQYQIGMPDLNTGNSFVQNKVLDFLKDCVDCGVDGFRFDTAKHIELPSDGESFRSNFWPTVLGGVRDYAADKNSELYIYGEVLDSNIGTDISNFTTYMAVTDDGTGTNARTNVLSKNAAGLKSPNYTKNTAASNCVIWVESHDTYTDRVTSVISDEDIVKTWAIIGSRSDATSLFLARPNDVMGLASTDDTWNSAAVAEVNKFKNVFNGQSEYLSSLGNTAYIERGTKGVVISNLDGAGEVRLNANKIVDGTYTDHVTGNTFTVADGVISGTVGSSGVAVVYNENDITNTETSVEAIPTKLYLDPGGSTYWDKDGARFAMHLWNDSTSTSSPVQMLDNDGDGIYEANVPSGNWTNVLFARIKNTGSITLSNRWNKTDDLELYKDGRNLFTINSWEGSDGGAGYWSILQHTHQYTAQPIWTWNETSSAFAVFENCTVCGKSRAEAASITSVQGDDTVVYTATVTLNGQTYTDTKTINIEAAEKTVLYLAPSAYWKTNDAEFALYAYNSSGNIWTNMTKINDNLYSVEVPYGNWTNIIFCRMNPNRTENRWNTSGESGSVKPVWGQTVDLTIPANGNNLYTVTENVWTDVDGTWSIYTSDECTHDYGNPVWTWADDYSSATAEFTCSLCGDVQNVAADVSCDINSTQTVYTATVTFNGQTYTDTKTFKILYLAPNTNWKSADAEFALYAFNSTTSCWTDMYAVSDSIYAVEVPDGDWTGIIFCRMNPSRTENRWNMSGESGKVKPVWGQTNNLTVPANSDNLYTIPEGENVWNTSDINGTWSFFCMHSYTAPVWCWTKTAEGYTAAMKSVCTECGDIAVYAAETTSSKSNGVITYTAAVTVDGTDYTSTFEVNESYTFTVVDGTITKGAKESYSYGDAVTVNADESRNGKYFSGWYIGDTLITTKQSYTFYVKSNMTVTAKYEGDDVQEEQADVSLIISRTDIANNKQKVVFSLNWALPEGCTLKEAGMVRRYDSTENLSLEYADGSTIKKNASTLRTLSGNCNFNLTVSATTKLRSINAAGYLIYVDKSGNTQTVYSTVQTSIYVNN